MSPRDIQAQDPQPALPLPMSRNSPACRLAKVERYEGPVLAEREYIAQQARKVEVATPSAGHDSIPLLLSATSPATLDEMVSHRLTGPTASTPPPWNGTPGAGRTEPGPWRPRASRRRPAPTAGHRRRAAGHVDFQPRRGSRCRTPTAGPSSSANWSPWTARFRPAASRPSRTGHSISKPTPRPPRAAPPRNSASSSPAVGSSMEPSRRRTPTGCWNGTAPHPPRPAPRPGRGRRRRPGAGC